MSDRNLPIPADNVDSIDNTSSALINFDTVERFEQVVCPFCDHTESSKQGNNIFRTDFYIDRIYHHSEEIECKCHCHSRYLDD